MYGSVRDEFVGSNFGDERLDKRVLRMVDSISANPTLSINAACGSFAESKAAYRFLENEKVSCGKIRSGHRDATMARIRDENTETLLIQDTTDLVYTGKKSIEGLGKITSVKGYKDPVVGIKLHSLMACSSKGIPLGLLEQKYFTYEDYKDARGQKSSNERGVNKQFPIEEKCSYRWLELAESASLSLKKAGINTTLIHVADRECDIYEFIQLATELNDHYVVRSRADRRTLEENGISKLSVKLKRAKKIGNIVVVKDNKQRICSVRCCTVTLKAPQRLPGAKSSELKNFEVTALEVLEDENQDDRLHWRLLTNKPTNTFLETVSIIENYKTRWQIECFHRVLKSGYRIEKTRLNTRLKIERLSSFLSIMAWHIFWLYKIARVKPEIEANKIFDELAIKVAIISARKLEVKICKSNPTLAEIVLTISRMGGYLNRKNDPPPGMQVIWQGWKNLMERTEFMEEMTYG